MYLFIYLFTYLLMYLCICVFIYLFVYLFKFFILLFLLFFPPFFFFGGGAQFKSIKLRHIPNTATSGRCKCEETYRRFDSHEKLSVCWGKTKQSNKLLPCSRLGQESVMILKHFRMGSSLGFCCN